MITYTASAATLLYVEHMIHYPTGTSRASRSQISALATPSTTGVEGADVGVYPQTPIIGKVKYPNIAVLTYIWVDIPIGSTFPVTRYGVSRTYRAMQSGSGGGTVAYGATGSGLALIWD